MKKIAIAVLIGLLAGAWIMRAQSNATYAMGIGSAQTLANCPTPVSGTTYYCFAFDKIYESQNGAAYVVYGQVAAVAGVTSITVNGGTPQSGPVALTIPTKAVIPATTSPLQ